MNRSRQEDRRAIAAHYDLPSDLFSEFLDETMTYSSALFDHLPAAWPDLADAQRRKIDRLLDAANVGPGSQVLEIGTGWGELAIRAAARGANVRSLTLSERQVRLARKRVAAAGLSDRVQIDLRDYRDVGGNYDAVISVEMIEAIGLPRLAGVLPHDRSSYCCRTGGLPCRPSPCRMTGCWRRARPTPGSRNTSSRPG